MAVSGIFGFSAAGPQKEIPIINRCVTFGHVSDHEETRLITENLTNSEFHQAFSYLPL